MEDLRLFCMVVNKQSFAATALELGVSKALVSKRIAILEEVLRARLLHRTTRKVSATEHGHTVYQWAQRILEDAEQMAEAVSSTKITPRGLLRLCTSSGFGRNHVSRAISAMAQVYPDLEFQLELHDRPVDLVREGFDLDIRVGGVIEEHLLAKMIGQNGRVLCASPRYLEQAGMPAKLSDLARHRCIAVRERDQDFGRWKLRGRDGVESVRISGPLSANNGEIAHRWAIDGHGIILRSIWDVSPSLRRGELIRVLPDYEQAADVWAVYPSRLSTSAKVRVCVQFLEEWLASSI
jgi:LysR family transcriptional activator of dmlA